MESPLIQVDYRGGIHLPEMDLWLDPPFGVNRAFISHAHSDHVAKHQQTYASELTLSLLKVRYGLDAESLEQHGLHWNEVADIQPGWQLRLLPAGHIPGSAMLHLTRLADGASLLYTGDYKLRTGLSAAPCELLPAHSLIMECTFGLPQFHFPPQAEVLAQILKFVQETLEEGDIPVLLGYALGKAQEILCALAAAGIPTLLHRKVWEMTEALRPHLPELPPTQIFSAQQKAAGHVLIFPPTQGKNTALKKIKGCRTAMLSGWALQPGTKFRYQVDEVFPLSDHADYPELLETVERVQPQKIHLVHGYTEAFAADLRRRGYEAWQLERADQLEMALPEAPAAVKAANPATEVISETAEGSFQRWACACAAAAEHSSRQKKVQLLADYLLSLTDEELPLACRYSAGKTQQLHEKPLQMGWAMIRRALQELTGMNEAAYRAISRTQADSGRTAYLMLSQTACQQPAARSLLEIALFFQQLRHSSHSLQRIQLLKQELRQHTPHSGSWLIRLITGELRMGSKEGLSEEAVATAFTQSADQVREAAMLIGDLGETALLAKQSTLHTAQPQLHVPLKVMLASPEESSQAIWERSQSWERIDNSPLWLEDKYDGIRAQLHVDGQKTQLFSRDLKLLNETFPEIMQAATQASFHAILDGEIIAHAADKKLTFFDLQKRLGRRDQTDLFLPSDIQVQYVIFDLLWLNGQSLLSQPLSVRRQQLEQLMLPAGMTLLEKREAHSITEIEAAFLAARRRGNEGLIIKNPAEVYLPGRRGKAWLKLKKAFATLDVVVIKAEQGHGKRAHMLSDYTFALRDADGSLRTLGKAYSGLTDVEIEQLTEHFISQTLSEKGRVRTVVPDTVLEIAFDSIQPSQRHDSGLALRFPRIKAIRRDKSVNEIDTLAYAQQLAGVAQSSGSDPQSRFVFAQAQASH
jgi:DNA ligase 1